MGLIHASIEIINGDDLVLAHRNLMPLSTIHHAPFTIHHAPFLSSPNGIYSKRKYIKENKVGIVAIYTNAFSQQ